jgi:hypothetical protein
VPFLSQSQSQRYLTTDGQSDILSWCQANIKARDQFCFLLEIFFGQFRVCYFLAPSLTRGRVCNLLLLLLLASAVSLESEFRGTQDHILLSKFLKCPQPGGPGPRIYFPQEQDGLIIPPGTEFPSVASYDSQFDRRGILSRLHTGNPNLVGSSCGQVKVKVKVTLRSTYESTSPSWRQAPIWRPSGTRDLFCYLLEILF